MSETMRDRTCFVHVGTGKTGTTAIQYALAREQTYLLASGVDYPDFSRNHRVVLSGVPAAGNGAILYKKLKENDLAGAMKVIRDHVDNANSFIISCEGLWQLSKETLAGFVAEMHAAGFGVEGLACFRPQAEFVVSSYLQQVKSARMEWRMELEEYVEAAIARNSFGKSWSWLKVADKLGEVFGTEHLTVYWFPSQVMKGGTAIVEDFFSWIKVPMLTNDLGKGIANPSPNQEALMILRMMNAAGLGGKAFADTFLSEAHRMGLLDKRPMLSKKLQMQIDRLTRSDNEAMLGRYAPGQQAGMEIVGQVGANSPPAPLRKEVLADMLQLSAKVLKKA